MKKILEEYEKRNDKNQGGIYEAERGMLIKNTIGGGKKVLDLGARHGSLTKYYVEGNEVTGVDFDEKNLEVLKEKFGCQTILHDLNEDLDVLGLGQWDAVVMSEVLEHLYYPEKKVEQISRLIKPDGVFVGTVPNIFSLKNRFRLFFGRPELTAMVEPTHLNHFSARLLKKMLEKYFGEVEIMPIQQKKYMPLAALSPNLFAFMLGFVCRKPIKQ